MKIMIGVCCAAVLWLSWPYVALYNLVMALRSGDKIALEQQVSWPDVRQGFKEDFSAILAQKAAKDQNLKDNPFGGLAVVLGSVMADRLIDAYVTPAYFATLIQRGTLAPDGTSSFRTPVVDKPVSKPVVSWAFFNSPMSFLVVLDHEKKAGENAHLRMVMNFRDFSWKVVRVSLPLDQI